MSAWIDIAFTSLGAVGTGLLLQKAYEKFDWYPPETVYLAAVGFGAWLGLQAANKVDQKISSTVKGLGALMPALTGGMVHPPLQMSQGGPVMTANIFANQ